MKKGFSQTGRFVLLSALVVVLAGLNVLQMAMTPRTAAGSPGQTREDKVAKFQKFKPARTGMETVEAINTLNQTAKEVLAELKALRADLAAGKLQVQVAKPVE